MENRNNKRLIYIVMAFFIASLIYIVASQAQAPRLFVVIAAIVAIINILVAISSLDDMYMVIVSTMAVDAVDVIESYIRSISLALGTLYGKDKK